MSKPLFLNGKPMKSFKCGSQFELVKQNPGRKNDIVKMVVEFLETHKHTRKCLTEVWRFREKNPKDLPVFIAVLDKKGKCSYCNNISKIRGQVGRLELISKPGAGRWLTGGLCIPCINFFLPKTSFLTTFKKR